MDMTSPPRGTAITDELVDASRQLGERALLPDSVCCVFVAGSTVRGWSNPGSDIDLYVVSTGEWRGERLGEAVVALSSPTVPTHAVYVGDRRWELNYWTTHQVDQLLAKFAWELFDAGTLLAQPLSEVELKCAERLTYALPVLGGPWLRERRERVDASAFKATMVTVALARADDHIEDLAGQLRIGDVCSAVLSARFALGYAVDAMLASRGQLGREEKWRCRRFAEQTDLPVPFEEYWQLETMRSFDPSAPQRWIEQVVAACKRISMQVQV